MKVSEQVLLGLKNQAQASYDRPDVRLASIERLVAACNAIENGTAAETYRGAHGTIGSFGRNAKINPSTIEKYVKARLKIGGRDWTGPTRVFISADVDLRAYVSAREDERLKPTDTRTRPSQRQKDIEDAIGRLPSVELRQTLRHEIEEGRIARKRLDILTKGLRTLPGFDLDALLRRSVDQATPPLAEARPPAKAPSMPSEEVEHIKMLLNRLANEAEMGRAGMTLDGNRLRLSQSPRTTIISPNEMVVLRRLAGLEQQTVEAELLDVT